MFKRKSISDKEFSIGSQMTKLGVLFGVFIIVPIIISYILYDVADTAKDITAKNEKAITEVSLLGNISSFGLKQLALYKELGAGKGENGIDILETLGEIKTHYTEFVKVYMTNATGDKKVAIEVINKDFLKLDQTGKDMALAYLEEETETAEKIKIEFTKKAKVFEHDIEALISAAQLDVKKFNQKSSKLMDDRSRIAIGAMGITIFLSLIIGIFFIHSIKLIIRVEKSRQKAQRDTIKDIVEELSSASQSLQGTSTTLARLGQNLKTGSDVQGMAVESTTKALNQMKDVLKSNMESVSESGKVSSNTQEKISNGQEIVENLVAAMHEISESKDTLNRIQEMFMQVTEKTQFINNIVFQTKLLSFNASVEAARAGEYGKGFSVVAEEMSMLAESSGTAANEIKEILEHTSSEVKNTIFTINEKVKYGEEITSDCKSIFDEISLFNSSLGILIGVLSESSNRNKEHLDISSQSFQEIEDINTENRDITYKTLEQSSIIETQASDITKSITSLKKMVLSGEQDEEVVAQNNEAKSYSSEDKKCA